jgi:hypothetical protein
MLTQDQLRNLVRYSPVVGVFEKLIGQGTKRSPKRWILLGCSNSDTGYIYLSIMGKRYPAHRLAWLYVHGEFPEADIDHIDGDKTNNAISNLRKATRAQNSANSQTGQRNTSGIKGVSWSKTAKKWVARIVMNGQVALNAYFDDVEEARQAVEGKRLELQGEFANNGKHRYQIEEELASDEKMIEDIPILPSLRVR